MSEAAPVRPARVRLVLVLLALTMAAGNCMLWVFSAVQEAAKAELSLTDAQLALLQGLAASLPLAALSIPVGILVDRKNRVRLLLAMAVAWTAGTFLTAAAHSVTMLFAARMLTGLGANISTTVAISIAADLCRPETRGRSLLLLTIGKYAGLSLAFALGGWLLAVFGGLKAPGAWREVHLVLGVGSAALTLSLLLLREPARQEQRVGAAAPLREVARELWHYRAFLAPLFLGQVSVLMADSAATIWAAPVLSRQFGLAPPDFAGWMGAVTFGSGVLGAIGGGFAADWGHRRGARGGILLGAVAASVIALPAAFFPVSPDTVGFGLGLFVLLFGGTITGLITATALAVLLPNELRGLAIGAFIAFGGLIAFGLAPSLVVAVSGWFGGESGLASALALVGFAVSVLGAVGFILAYRRAPEPVR
ncbi:MAG: MFS transporter [Tsuneonella sp.]